MSLRFQLERAAQLIADAAIAIWPRRRPGRERLRACRLISHRGEHDNRLVRENTLAAFARAVEAGVWGIEFDLRWTRDLQPVVIHDPDSARVFGLSLPVADYDLEELQSRLPEVPSLAQVVAKFGGKVHLMIELKRDRFDRDQDKAERLLQILGGLDAGRDYHFLALAPDLFAPAAFAGDAACLLVAEINTRKCSDEVIDRGYGGLCGHYMLLSTKIVARHKHRGQKVGTGFAASRFGFYREINRGVDWIFTNRACALAQIREQLLAAED